MVRRVLSSLVARKLISAVATVPVVPEMLIAQYIPGGLATPVAPLRPETYFPLTTPPLPVMIGPSLPTMSTFTVGTCGVVDWADSPATAPKPKHSTAINFTKKDALVTTLHSPLPFQQTRNTR
jgi:hypothetical protein